MHIQRAREVQYWLIIHVILLGYYAWYICCMSLMDVMHIIHTIRLVYLYICKFCQYIFVFVMVYNVYLSIRHQIYIKYTRCYIEVRSYTVYLQSV